MFFVRFSHDGYPYASDTSGNVAVVHTTFNGGRTPWYKRDVTNDISYSLIGFDGPVLADWSSGKNAVSIHTTKSWSRNGWRIQSVVSSSDFTRVDGNGYANCAQASYSTAVVHTTRNGGYTLWWIREVCMTSYFSRMYVHGEVGTGGASDNFAVKFIRRTLNETSWRKSLEIRWSLGKRE